jgi:hypothetical protein
MRGRPDRHEVARVVADAGRQHRRGHVRAHAAGKERVAVGCRGRDPAAADHAACAADVLDHQRLSERLAHLLGDDACHHVARAAGRERHDDVDRAIGVVLRLQGSEPGRMRSGCRQSRPPQFPFRTSWSSPFAVWAVLCRLIWRRLGFRSVVLQNLRHFDLAPLARRQDSRAHHGERLGRIFSADLGLRPAAHRVGEFLKLLHECVVLRHGHG